MELPKSYRVLSNKEETPEIFTLALSSDDKAPFGFQPGQFNMVYLFGNGEVPISISSNPVQKDLLLHTIRAVGPVTEGLRKLRVGDTVGIRGPFGTSWPLDKKDCEVLIVAGGVGLAPLRAALYHLANQRDQYQKVTVLYGSRTPDDIMFKEDIKVWKEKGLDIAISVDRGDMNWTGPVGVVTPLINKHVYNPKKTLAFICGPEIMIYYAVQELVRAKVPEESMYISMERNMQCGVGFCGHCQYGPYFICKDGPVFCYTQIKKWLTIKEL